MYTYTLVYTQPPDTCINTCIQCIILYTPPPRLARVGLLARWFRNKHPNPDPPLEVFQRPAATSSCPQPPPRGGGAGATCRTGRGDTAGRGRLSSPSGSDRAPPRPRAVAAPACPRARVRRLFSDTLLERGWLRVGRAFGGPVDVGPRGDRHNFELWRQPWPGRALLVRGAVPRASTRTRYFCGAFR